MSTATTRTLTLLPRTLYSCRGDSDSWDNTVTYTINNIINTRQWLASLGGAVGGPLILGVTPD